ncbi:hypothetical protein [Asanoa siamensis]|uniref:Secreted protein n=1 Tax=Asanoa siamensis TaxID=926357 RepID=A0ABQ4CQL9_9ACTN|nr:hypothetical protein [Asanoa siamensis]GIF73569.1 hypothetical protein Asi02nite_30870 [Asanoa siamensis]
MKIIPKTLARSLAVVALAAPAILMGSAQASAAVRIFPADGGTCVGTQVMRCLELRYDDASERFRARAEITDVAGGSDATVDITRVIAAGQLTGESPEPNPTWERLESPFTTCTQGRQVSVGFSADFRWKNNATGAVGSETRYGYAVFTCS